MIVRTAARTLTLGLLILSAAACTVTPTSAPGPTPTPNTLFVDAASPLGVISPYLTGSNYGPWLFLSPALYPQVQAAQISYLRYPGGNWGDLNDLEEWQIDQFIALTKQLKIEPSLSVRLLKSTPAKAAALVTYVNVTKKYGVKYWSIGNEPSLYGKDYDTVRFNKEWREFATAMRAVDPSIKLIGPEIHQFTANPEKNPKDASGRDWLIEFLKANGEKVDIVAVHRYPFPADGRTAPTRDELLANSREWDEIVPLLRRLIRENVKKDLPVAITEVNSNWANMSGGEATPETFYNALWWSDVLARLIRYRVDIVAQFALQSAPGAGEYGLFTRTEPRPTYYAYLLYARFGKTLLTSSTDDPDLNVVAAKADDGALTIVITNLTAQPIRKPLQVLGVKAPASAETFLLDPTHNATQVAPTPLNGPVTLPPYSTTLLIIKP